MKFYEQTVVVQAEAETIWDVLADVKNWTDWDGGLQFVQNIGDGLVEDGVSIFVFSGGLSHMCQHIMRPLTMHAVTEVDQRARRLPETH